MGERRTWRVAAVQLTSGVDVAGNVAAALAGVERGADEGAQYVLVPEYVTYYGPSRGFAAAAESVPGPSTERFAEVARRRGVVVHVGSLLERTADPERFHNTSVVIDANGEIAATYRKAHLFDIDAPGMASYLESERIVPGDEAVVARVGGVSLGLSICFDLRFPELYRRLVADGAEVLAVPAAFTFATGQHHWELLVRARAVDSLAFVVAAAQVGTTAEGLATWGHSMIVDPWGEVLARSDAPGPDVLVATIDLDEVTRRRAQLDLARARRPEVYL